MTCPFCRSQNPETAQRCSTCGQVLAAAPAIGSVVAGRYEILAYLGSGGMGTVFKARDRKLDETVAIKFLRADASDDPDLATRFRSEIKLAWKVRHRNVCGIHEYGEDGNLLYISMELVEGRNFRQLLREQGALLWEDAYDVALQVAEGLQAIHEAGVIHRDLKTANIIRDERGLVRLLDFGIAKVWGDESGAGLTGTGKVVGTPRYMSPEQLGGRKVDFRSDIYALGIVIFEIFTGRVPSWADTPKAAMPPLEGPEGAQIPTALGPVLRKALATDPDDRYPTCAEIMVALREARAALPQQRTDVVVVGSPAPQAPAAAGADVRSAGVPASSLAEEAGPVSYPRSPYARFLVPSLVKGLRHPDEKVRTNAAQALGNVGAEAGAAIPALVEALRDEAWTVRVQAVHALAVIGPDAAEALAALAEAQQDRDTRVRAAAAAALARSTPQAPAAPSAGEASPIAKPTAPPSVSQSPPREPEVEAAAPHSRASAIPQEAGEEAHEGRPPGLAALVAAVVAVVLLLALWMARRHEGPTTTTTLPSPTTLIGGPTTTEPPPGTVSPPSTALPPTASTLARAKPSTISLQAAKASTGAAAGSPAPPETTEIPLTAPATTLIDAVSSLPASETALSPSTTPPPTPTPSAPPIQRPLAAVEPPRCQRCPTPGFPPIAERRHVEGMVKLRVHVDSSGKVVEAQVVSGVELLTEQAVKAVMKWTYRPGTKDGVPVDFWIPVSVRFALDR